MTTSTPSPARRSLALLSLPLAAGALALSACNLDIEFDGETTVETFDLETFDSVRIDSAFEATIRQGETQSVQIEISEHRLNDLEVGVINGELSIDLDTGSFSFDNALIATITVTDLDSLDVSGASDVVVADLDVDDLVIEASGASRVRADGAIGTLDLELSGASSASFDGTTIDSATLRMRDASSANFPASTERITGSMSGASSLNVADQTSVSVDTSGASTIDRN